MKNLKEIGKILKETRQKKGLTIEEIYGKTRIQPKVIENLEEGRTEEALSKVYALLFLRKYALFLGLDSESLLASYKSFYKDKEKVVLVDVEKKPPAINIKREKWMIRTLSAALIFIFIFFVIFLSLKLKASYGARKAKAVPSVVAKPAPKEEAKSQEIFPIAENKPIGLVLQSSDEVWMKAKKDGQVVFEGTLHKGGKKELSANDNIEFWVGRAEVLDFTINGKSIGTVGKGKIKSVQFSRHGVKIGNKWLLKAKE